MNTRWAIAVAALFSSQAVAQAQEDPARLAVRQAEAALDAGRNADALALALRYTDDRARDARGWIVLGRAYLASDLPHARAAATRALTRATELAPDRAEAWDWLARAGLALGGSDGEWYVLTASERTLALDPMYPGAWELWLGVYRDAATRERMLGFLSAHREIPEVRAHIARVLIEGERYTDANAESDALVALEPENAEWLALRAQSAFEGGDSSAGFGYYDRALSHADRDTSGFLWQQVVGIASPGEIRAWNAGIAPGAREAFFRRFWARRDPNLFATHNTRIAEHFARLRVARRQFPLKFPLSRYETNRGARAVAATPGYGENLFYARCEAQQVPGGPIRAEDRARMPLEPVAGGVTTGYFPLFPTAILEQWKSGIQGPGTLYIDPELFGKFGPPLALSFPGSIRDVDTTAAGVGYNLRTGLDDRGTTYLRFGEPKHRAIGSDNTSDPFCRVNADLERWTYDDIGTVRFFRPEGIDVGGVAGGGAITGDLVFRPMGNRQFEAMAASLTEDATGVPAPLSFGVWVAQFAGAEPGVTEVAVIGTRGRLAAELVGGTGMPRPRRETGDGLVLVPAAPGTYLLMAHAAVGDTLGRQSLPLVVRPLGSAVGISDLVMAPSWPDVVVTRARMLDRIQRDLGFASGTTLRSYGEIYGLPRDPDGRVHYWASYQIYKTNDVGRASRRRSLPGAVVLGFERSKPADDVVAEWLDITLQRLQPGRYLLRLDIQEPDAGNLLARAQLGFEIRPEPAP